MQVAACPNVEYVSVDKIPDQVVQKEKEIEMGKEDLGNKPDNIKEKIVQGRIDKRLKEMTLLDQPYIRDQNISVAELINQVQSKVSEPIKVHQFVRYILGEGIEKQESNFAQEVAAQIGTK
jgi:elongation factor Ts